MGGDDHRIFSMPFAQLYPLYVAKAERKGRTRAEVDQVICWMTGHDEASLRAVVADESVDVRGFLARAPAPNPDRELVTGKVCGVRVEDVEHPTMREVRRLDKLVDELAKGRPMEKVLRSREP